ncbi:hypothetical protein DM01DRAFT_1408168 [Hesseltinella vesiculosa]|uniref:Uncharacterized protein n=1 Tax=Hesseltinella vesiculosa TaxID=101127 RepID=A0A1X2GG41_9FUNG|nr:hypothetical protein DM01DRAFT_1408168 [Hesseltinella vesiculosa]
MQDNNGHTSSTDNSQQPAHVAFLRYQQLEINDTADRHLPCNDFQTWKMNLCATSRIDPSLYFIAANNAIRVHRISGRAISFDPVGLLRPEFASDSSINAIKIGHMTKEIEILVAVGDMGEVYAWRLDAIEFNDRNDQPPVLFHDTNDQGTSTWGIAIHESGLLAVSANNYKIKVFNMATMLDLPVNNVLSQQTNLTLEGHNHNIPSIDIDSTGRFLISGSIDATCRLWDLSTGQQIAQRTLGSQSHHRRSWCWGAKFIPPGQFKRVECRSSALSRSLERKLTTRQAESMNNIPVSHSAPYPMIRLGRQGLYDSDDDDEDQSGVLDFEDLARFFFSRRSAPFSENAQRLIFDLIRQRDPSAFNFLRWTQEAQLEQEAADPSLNDSASTSIPPTSEGVVQQDSWDSPVQGVVTNGFAPMTIFPRGSDNLTSVPGDYDHGEQQYDWNQDLEMENGYTDTSAASESSSRTPTSSPTTHSPVVDISNSDSRLAQAPLHDLLLLTTQLDLHLLQYNPHLTQQHPLHFTTLQFQNRIISKVDIRNDSDLSLFDRLVFLEWIPELELCVLASQKGCVALVRILQVQLPSGHSVYFFNHERYLPTEGLHNSSLYGLTVRRISQGLAAIDPRYQVDLVYLDGAMFSYQITSSDPDYSLMFHA